MLVRILFLTSLFYAACSCKPVPVTGEQGTSGLRAEAETVQLQVYERRLARSGEVLAPPLLLRLSGTLEQKNGCLIVTSGTGDHALVFEAGRATYDATRGALIIGSANFARGTPISVGGPFNQPAESFDPVAVKRRCGVNSIWLVTGADVRPNS
jgi:hypothetical protein